MRYLVLVVLAVGCASQPDSHVCATGIVCPATTQCAAAQPVCITNDCGNGKVDTGEECDDGNVLPGDGCSPTCQDERCGNGIPDPGEVCDDGNTVSGDGCSADCKSLETCGNGIKDVNEACDDGNTVGGDGCSANCKSTEVCGNCIVDTEVGEVCDTCGVPTASCSANCRSVLACGNGMVDPGEECDNTVADNIDTNDCRADCVINRCGDGYVDSGGPDHHEDCDPAPQAPASSRAATPVETAQCNLDCTTARCGDGKINRTAGEQCDDGGTIGGDGCSADCKLEYCGNGVQDVGEPCDPSVGVSPNAPAECNSDCTLSTCGDGKVNTAAGEQCDSTPGCEPPGSAMQCKLPYCGNDLLDTGEQCDDGVLAPTSACVPGCQNAQCGDGYVHTGVEQCDLGTANGVTTCPYGATSCTVCTSLCATAPGTTHYCGDGTTTGADGEICDNGTANGASQCPYGPTTGCTLCSSDCKTSSSGAARYCGDGVIQGDSGEQCDNGVANTNTPCTPSYNSTCMTCNTSCHAVTETGGTCGDNVINGNEQCDGTAAYSATCASLGFAGGTLGCHDSTCLFDTTACTQPATCTDGIQNEDETDKDCGGSICLARCAAGKKCITGSDCVSGSCGATTTGICD